jgi:hypothetical protein
MSVEGAPHVIARPEVAGAGDDLARVIGLYRIVFQRAPKPLEIQLAMQFVATEAKNQPAQSPAEQKAKNGLVATGKKSGKGKGNGRYDSMSAIQNQGDVVERRPLTAWETYAQALLFSNEASYVN